MSQKPALPLRVSLGIGVALTSVLGAINFILSIFGFINAASASGGADGLWIFIVVFFLAAFLISASICGCVSGCGERNRVSLVAFIVLTTIAGVLSLFMSIWCYAKYDSMGAAAFTNFWNNLTPAEREEKESAWGCMGMAQCEYHFLGVAKTVLLAPMIVSWITFFAICAVLGLAAAVREELIKIRKGGSPTMMDRKAFVPLTSEGVERGTSLDNM